jgi:modulator of FtsH protease HflC
MKSIAITVFVLLVVLVLVLEGITFQVREPESVLVTTFGKPTRQIQKPGLYFKLPPPINNIYRFDCRLRVFDADFAETTTKGNDSILVHTYIVWRIADPLKFLNSVGSVTEAENKLHSQLNNAQNNVIGRYYFSDFVNSDKSRIQIVKIQQEMLESLSKEVGDTYGIKIEDLGIKQLKVPADVTKGVFERMRSERNRKTVSTIQEGQSIAVKIRSDANSLATELLAAAEARAKTIMGQGDAEAAQYYQMLEADPSLAIFLRDIEALQEILSQRSTYFISTDKWPFSILRQMPDLEPKK